MHPVAPWSPMSTAPDLTRPQAPELLAAMQSLGHALGAPDEDPLWVDRTLHRLQVVGEAFAAHVEAAEGADGIYADAVRTDGRLGFRAMRLCREHIALESRLASITALVRSPGVEPMAIRHPIDVLLNELRKHRQRGADLIFEAYQQELGGDG